MTRTTITRLPLAVLLLIVVAMSTTPAARAQQPPASTTSADTNSAPGDDTSSDNSVAPGDREVEPKDAPAGTSFPMKDGGRLWYLAIDTSLVRPRVERRPARQVLVYTPAGYESPEHASDRYPVLYLLHGSPGFPTDFVRHADWPALLEKVAHDTGRVPPILVMPDGNYSGERHGDSEWANSADGRDLFEDYIVNQVVPWTDKRFRTIDSAAGRMIGGVSEGGYGCVNLALHHPDVFGSVIALSGYFDNGGYGWARKVLGYDENYLRANSPLAYLDTGLHGLGPREWRTIHFFLGVGSSETPYTAQTEKLADKLKSIGAPTDLQMMQGKHGWELWSQLYYDGMKWILTQSPGVSQARGE